MSISRLFEIQQMSFSKSNNFHIFDVLGNSCKFKSRENICYYQALIYCIEYTIRKHGWRCSSFLAYHILVVLALEMEMYTMQKLINFSPNRLQLQSSLIKSLIVQLRASNKATCGTTICVIENIFKIVGNVSQFDKHCVSWKIIIIETNTRSLRFVFQLCHFNMCFLF